MSRKSRHSFRPVNDSGAYTSAIFLPDLLFKVSTLRAYASWFAAGLLYVVTKVRGERQNTARGHPTDRDEIKLQLQCLLAVCSAAVCFRDVVDDI